MNAAFRLSSRWRLLVRSRPLAVALVLLALLAFARSQDGEMPITKLLGFLAFTAALSFFAWRFALEDLKWALHHELRPQADGLLIVDGEDMTLLPYDRVARIRCTRIMGKVVRLTIWSDSKKKSLMHYENVDALAKSILAAVPGDKIRVSTWFMPNTSLERTRER